MGNKVLIFVLIAGLAVIGFLGYGLIFGGEGSDVIGAFGRGAVSDREGGDLTSAGEVGGGSLGSYGSGRSSGGGGGGGGGSGGAGAGSSSVTGGAVSDSGSSGESDDAGVGAVDSFCSMVRPGNLENVNCLINYIEEGKVSLRFVNDDSSPLGVEIDVNKCSELIYFLIEGESFQDFVFNCNTFSEGEYFESEFSVAYSYGGIQEAVVNGVLGGIVS